VRRRIATARFDRRPRFKLFTSIPEAPTGDLTLSLVCQVVADRDLTPQATRCVSGRLKNMQTRFDMRFGCNIDSQTPSKQRLQFSMRVIVSDGQSVVSNDGGPHPCNQYVPGGDYGAWLTANPSNSRQTQKTWDSENLTPEQYAAIFPNVTNEAFCRGMSIPGCGQHFDEEKDIEIGWSGITGILPGSLPWHSETTDFNTGNNAACFNAYSEEKLRIKIGRFATCENPLP
jgi:hypothetical protein